MVLIMRLNCFVSVFSVCGLWLFIILSVFIVSIFCFFVGLELKVVILYFIVCRSFIAICFSLLILIILMWLVVVIWCINSGLKIVILLYNSGLVDSISIFFGSGIIYC